MMVWVSRCAYVAIALSLAGCQSFNLFKKKPEPAPVVVAPAPVVEAPMSQQVRLLILNGEYTLARDQLLTPINDNAFDYFSAALRLEPNNTRAKGGIQGIVMRYVDLARQAAARGNYSQAKLMLNMARSVDRNNLLIKEVSDGLDAQMRLAPPVAAYKGGSNEFLLDSARIGKDDPVILARISEIVAALKKADGLAMIVARSDVEGRWIYQKMREASPDYRVRGDIKIGSPVRVIIESAAQ